MILNLSQAVAGAFITLFFIGCFIVLTRIFMKICPPNEVYIFSGRGERLADGRGRGYRVLFGGRALYIPIFMSVERMSLNIIEVPIAVRNAYSQGGIPLAVDAIANVKISGEPAVIGNAIERFLGRDLNEIRRVAKETLEGHLRGVLARLTPEEVNEDRLKFVQELAEESELDLRKLGIHLDTLKIQHVSDDLQYLDAIGREAIANVIKAAEIVESDAQRAAEMEEAGNEARASVKEANVNASISQMKNELRKIQADLEASVKAEEERTLAAAREARAIAEQELQRIRTIVAELRLRVDQILPAEANRTAQENLARGEAAILRERGVAMSQALHMMHSAWSQAGEHALSIYLIEDIEKILASASKGANKISIDQLQMIDSGDGKVLSNYVAAYPEMLHTVFRALEQTTGIAIEQAISTRPTPTPNTEANA